MEFPKVQFRAGSSSSSSSSSHIPPHKTQLHPRMQPFSSLIPPPNSKLLQPSTITTNNPHKYLLLFISISLLPFLIYLLSLYRSVHLSSKFTPSTSDVYGFILHIDRFQSHVRVFRSLNEGSQTPLTGDSSNSKWVPVGLSGFSDDGPSGERVENLVSELIYFAKKKIPRSEWKKTLVQFMVRGGVDLGETGFDVGNKVMDVGRRLLKSSGFSFKDDHASVLSGKDESFFAWVALNYVLGTLGREPKETSGIVEIGEAVVKVTYATRVPQLVKLSRPIRFAGVSYSLYTQSLPEFSQDNDWKSLLEQPNSRNSTFLNDKRTVSVPCIPKGYEKASNNIGVKLAESQASGSFSECRSQVTALLKERKGKCPSPTCKTTASLFNELNGKSSPPRRFIYSSKFLGSVLRSSSSELEDAGHHFCEDGWDKLKKQHHDIEDADLLRYCFAHAYAVALLHDTIGIPDVNKGMSLKTDGMSSPVDWALGAFIFRLTSEPLIELGTTEVQDLIVGNESITYFSLFGVLLVFVLLAAFFVMKLRKPQFKTIYDLEKGRYIVTRVPR